MSKTEYAWVIQRDDGMFYVRTRTSGHRIRHLYSPRLLYAHFENCESEADETIKVYNLQNCRPVRVKISIVGEDDGD